MKKILIILLSLLSFNAKSQQPPIGVLYVPSTASYTYLLDSYPNATIAYATVKLRSAYSGDCLRVRRSSDDAEQDIGFAGNYLDTASLKTFVSSNSGYVVKWYNQSDSANWFAFNTTTSFQPRIVNAGVVERQNGSPSVRFITLYGLYNGLNVTTSAISVSSHSIFSVFQPLSSLAYQRIASFRRSGDGSDDSWYCSTLQLGVNSFGAYMAGNVAAVSVSGTALNLYDAIHTGSEIRNANNNGTPTTASNSLGTFNIVSYSVGQSDYSIRPTYNGNANAYISCVVAYNADKTSDRGGINSIINGYYAVY